MYSQLLHLFTCQCRCKILCHWHDFCHRNRARTDMIAKCVVNLLVMGCYSLQPLESITF